jgi:NAD(P)-dependent dehydrogenase (short-subunit alcohol dehydrogenase family)
LDILVNNAAYSPRNLPTDGFPLEGQNLAQWDAQLAVILTGTFLVSRACARPLANHAKGTIINIASIYGLVGPVPSLYAGTALVNEAHYAAGKGGIVQLTRYLATTLAPSVRVNCIAPGGIKAQQPESFHERYNARTPMGRMANPEDMKGALAYLASDLSSYMTGQVLAVDGGWTAW